MASNWGPFLSYWGTYCKDVLYTQVVRGQQSVHFSEGLLKTLCYETDVGCIPRGFKLDTSEEKPKYLNSENWHKNIQGCYWCVDDNTDINGICCSKDCFYYLHDWCVERVYYFTKRRFCRLPGCDLVVSNSALYCNMTHEGSFDAVFPKGSDYATVSKSVIRAGPTWYCSSGKSTQQSCSETQSNPLHTNFPPPNKDKNTKKDEKQTKRKATPIAPIMDFPTELHSVLIFKTDIGIIPRSPPKEHHLISPYYSSPNWLREIKGCYWCGNKSKMVNDNFCTYRCYLIFYEWCLRRVYTFTGVRMCRDTGCNRIAAVGFDCCNKEHAQAINVKYNGVKKVDLDRVCHTLGPNFYKKCDVPNIAGHKEKYTQPQQPPTPTPVPQPVTEGYQCCNKEHDIRIKQLYKTNSINDMNRLSQLSPKWYKKSNSPNELVPQLSTEKKLIYYQKKTSPCVPQRIQNILSNTQPITHKHQETSSISINSDIILPETDEDIASISPSVQFNPFLDLIPAQQNIPSNHPTESNTDLISPNPFSQVQQKSNEPTTTNLPELYPFTLSRKLTDLLAQHTDVGIIPRNQWRQRSAVSYPDHSNNWSADIPSCYWCELSNTSFHELTCGRRCWLLFHEWCVRKVETGCGVRLCVLPGCENSQVPGCSCCSLEHMKEISELRGSYSPSIEEEVELTLGPKWYTDLSPIYISKTGAFYEFSNYFPSLLSLNEIIWPTVFHYLCAQKLIGTPYSNQICEMECINELERWMKRRTLKKWLRPDWGRIWEGPTHKAVFTKFKQNKVLKGMLLKTGRRPLVCRDGSLGDMLVSLREWFRTYRYYPNQQTTKIHLTPSVDNSEIVSKTSPPVTAAESTTQDIVVPKCEQPTSDDSGLNDVVTVTIQGSDIDTGDDADLDD